MSSIRDNCVSIRGNLKYKTWRILYSLVYVVRKRALHDMSRLKLTGIDCRFMPVRRLIPFERALNTTYVNLTNFLCTAPEKIVFLYWKEQLMNMTISSRRDAIRSAECGAYFTVVSRALVSRSQDVQPAITSHYVRHTEQMFQIPDFLISLSHVELTYYCKLHSQKLEKHCRWHIIL